MSKIRLGGLTNSGLSELVKNDRFENGFFDRFLNFFPEGQIKRRWQVDELDQVLIDNYNTIISRIYHNLKLKNDNRGRILPKILNFSVNAYAEYVAWYNINNELIAATGTSERIQSIYTKYNSYVPRLALILEVMKWGEHPSNLTHISSDSMFGAIELIKYFREQVNRIIATIKDNANRRANDQFDWGYIMKPGEVLSTGVIVKRLQNKFNVCERTAKSYLKSDALKRIDHGEYCRIN